MPADTPYFHAQYRQEYPLENGKDYVILDTKGKGHYVGTVLSVRTRSPNWFGEGDEKILIDGEKKPSIWGTGTEDYFLQAWGLNKTCTPFFGTPYYDQNYRLIGSHICCYRWHLADPIVFQKGIKVTFEHYGWTSVDENPDHKLINWNEREDDFSSVAYWYQTGESTFAARAPSADQRRLPSIERVTVNAKDLPTPSTTAAAMPARRNCRSCTTSRSFSSAPRTPEEAWIEIPLEVKRKEPLRLLLKATCAPDLRPLPGDPRRRAGRRADGFLRRRDHQPRNSRFWTSGPSRASTFCGWRTGVRTSFPTAYLWGSNRSVSASVVPASRSTATTRTRTGGKARNSCTSKR